MAKLFVDRLSLDMINLKIISENRPKTSGFSQFKRTFFGQLWNNVKANWLMLLFCLPVIVWIIVTQVDQLAANTSIPYSAGLGIPYPVVTDAHIVGALVDFELALKRALIMLPLIIIASLGLAGVFNVVKYLVWGFQIKIIRTFFRGIKNSYAPFIWVGMMLGVCFLLLTLVIYGFPVTDTALVWRVFAYIAVAVVCFFVLLLSLFVMTQAAVFNLSLIEILKNSLFLGTRFLLQNSMILVAGLVTMALPLLTFNSFVAVIANMLFFFMAFSYMACVFTIYSQYLYEMIYDSRQGAVGTAKVVRDDEARGGGAGRNKNAGGSGSGSAGSGSGGSSGGASEAGASNRKPQSKGNQPYQNPKKKKKKS